MKTNIITAVACALLRLDMSAQGTDVLMVRCEEAGCNEKNITRFNMTIDAISNNTIDQIFNTTVDQIPNATIFQKNNTDSLLSPSSSSTDDSPVKMEMSTFAQIIYILIIFLITFGLSASVEKENLQHQLKKRYTIITSIIMQFLFMPLLGYLTVLALRDHGLTPPMGFTLLIVTSCPGSNFLTLFTSLSNADTTFSVMMMALSTFFCIILLPANLALCGHLAYGLLWDKEGEVENLTSGDDFLKKLDFKTLYILMGLDISAIFAGFFASDKVSSHQVKKITNILGMTLLMIFFLGITIAKTIEDRSTDMSIFEQHWSLYIGALLPAVVANLIYLAPKLYKPDCVTFNVTGCCQNIYIAISAAVAVFDDPTKQKQALAVPIVYLMAEVFSFILYDNVARWAGWFDSDDD